jgi:hypothetical protein
MVVETFGSWAPDALVLLDEIATQYAIHQGCTGAVAARILFQRLSVTLMRLNARMLLVRAPIGFSDEEPLGYEDLTARDEDTDLWEECGGDATIVDDRF